MSDLENVLKAFCGGLNSFLRTSLAVSEDLVVLSNLANADGTVPASLDNKVVVSLARIEQTERTAVPGKIGPSAPAPMNFYVLVLANFGGANYATGLQMISRVLEFIEDNPVFDHSNLPGLDAGVTRVSFAFVNLDDAQWYHYLRMAGITYLSAAMYRVGVVPAV